MSEFSDAYTPYFPPHITDSPTLIGPFSGIDLTVDRTVLVVENSPGIATRVSAMLAKITGLRSLATVGSVQDAKRLIRRRPDVIILDLALSDGSGMRVMEDVASQKLSSAVIVITTTREPRIRTRCLELGAFYVLDKALDFPRLGEYVCRAIRESQ